MRISTRLFAAAFVFGLLFSGSLFSGALLAGETAPGSSPYPEDLRAKLDAALASQGSDYVPRTKHLTDDGKARFTNRLILENSPYLLQHAHNPVDWHPWGDEAFRLAKELNRPVLMSVGYTTCHWCHVMEEESFESLKIAEVINKHFIAVKVDRERRPDVDAIYMDAVRVLTRGGGGWPMTVIMNADREPFFGGTYIPPFDGSRGARKGFYTILQDVVRIIQEEPDRIDKQADRLTEVLQELANPHVGEGEPGHAEVNIHIESLYSSFDSLNGGFGRAPKFPRPATLDLLMRHWRRSQEPQSFHIATHTLDKMADGGIYDHVGSGFHRYTVDADWKTPHFEKMLYDNALLVNTYLDAYQATGEGKAARIARDVLGYVLREMTAPNGGYYSATDAVSMSDEGESKEGWYFTWTLKEVRDLLNDAEEKVFLAHHPVTAMGNFEFRNILLAPRHRSETAKGLSMGIAQFEIVLTSCYSKLFAAREQRAKPILDDKIIVGWNGLMISAMARGGFVLKDPRFVDSARRAASHLREAMLDGSVLRRTSRGGEASHRGVLDDYAFFIQGLLDLFETTQEMEWLELAVALQETLDQQFHDPEGGGYFLASKEQDGLLVKQKPEYDGAIPSGNSVTAANCLRLHEFTTEDRYRQRAQEIFQTFIGALQGGTGLPAMASALEMSLDAPKQIILVRPNAEKSVEPFLAVLRKTYLPNRIMVVVDEPKSAEVSKRIPLAGEKVCVDGKVTAYVCENRVCQLPTTDPTVFAEQIATVKPWPEVPEVPIDEPEEEASEEPASTEGSGEGGR